MYLKKIYKKYLNYLSNLYSFNHGHILSAIQCNTHNGKLHMNKDLEV